MTLQVGNDGGVGTNIESIDPQEHYKAFLNVLSAVRRSEIKDMKRRGQLTQAGTTTLLPSVVAISIPCYRTSKIRLSVAWDFPAARRSTRY